MVSVFKGYQEEMEHSIRVTACTVQFLAFISQYNRAIGEERLK